MKLAAVGDNCIDYYEATKEAFPGGNPVNVAVYFKRLGGQASYIGAVGTDSFGEVIVNGLNKKGIDTSHLHVNEGKTALTYVELKDGDRIFGDYEEGVMAEFDLSKDDLDFIKAHDIIVSGIWGHVEDYIPILKKAGMMTAFDFATKMEDPIVNRIIGYVDYAFFSSDEEDIKGLKERMKKMQAHGSKIVVFTRGEQGSIAYDGEEFYEYGIVPCEVVDTIGAGDSFIAGFLYGILRGYTVEESMEVGAKNSSITISYTGAW